ncbi:MAG: 50S ribosomal protein L4 [Bacteroidales bacterium]|jgi:large subunit ribosomal protein L4|nr:50S ribosomal protein L4 [Bacteroidales bacterium]MDD2570839.1 50S ribosomal protein L4 [Bacteroidales bacterium]MDD2812159.1 50S ribosomal protein L4 [Bacteroidales bacterium]MDD3384425.1 50S ribosomal protein L4 [Bacteroidales bacterium]MDD3810921.1 50S ribosomal protein L4 [Bacteroidales bacterium]
MEVAVVNNSGEKTGRTVQLRDDVFSITPNDHAIYLDVKQFLANRRQGTHKAKQRNEVAGSTKKLKRQKGTGTARAGSIKSPLFRGGGRVFGPMPRDYSFKLNKKVKQLARKSALSYKAQNDRIMVLEDLVLEAPKTRMIAEIRQNLRPDDKKMLLVLNQPNKNIYLSSRNLQGIKVVTVSELNTYDVLNASTVAFFESSVDALNENFGQ